MLVSGQRDSDWLIGLAACGRSQLVLDATDGGSVMCHQQQAKEVGCEMTGDEAVLGWSGSSFSASTDPYSIAKNKVCTGND